MKLAGILKPVTSFAGSVLLMLQCSFVIATDYQHEQTVRLTSKNSADCHNCEVRSVSLSSSKLAMVWSIGNADQSQVAIRLLDVSNVETPVLSTEMAVDATSSLQGFPRILLDRSGGFSVFWADHRESIMAQSFSAEGMALTSAQSLVSRGNTIDNFEVKELSNGKRLLVWSSDAGVGVSTLSALVLNASNVPQGYPFEIARAESWGSGALSVIAMKNGNYWVAYEYLDANTQTAIRLNRYSITNELLESTLVNDELAGDNLHIHGTLMMDRGVRLTWTSQTAEGYKIYSQKFNGNGKLQGKTTLVDPAHDEVMSHPKINPLLDGNYVVSWRTANLLHGKVYGYKGAEKSDVLIFNSQDLVGDPSEYGVIYKHDVTISALTDEMFIAIWREGSASDSDLYAKVFQHNRRKLVGQGRPVADGGPDLLKHTRSTYYLDAFRSGDSAGGENLQYSWTLVSKPETSKANVSNGHLKKAQFYPDALGEYQFDLEVTDLMTGEKHIDRVAFHHFNNKPVAKGGGNKKEKIVGRAIQLLGRNSHDVDSDYISYHWEIVEKPANSNPVIDNPNSPTPRVTPDVQGRYVLKLKVKDAWVESEADTVVIEFENVPPVANPIYEPETTEDSPVTLDGTASRDDNRDPLQHHWKLVGKPSNSAVSIDESTDPLVTFTPDVPGTYDFDYKVNDGLVDSKIKRVSVKANPAEQALNRAPVAFAGEDKVVQRIDLSTQLDGRQSSDEDGDTLRYSWSVKSKPVGSEVGFDNTFSPTPRVRLNATGEYVVSLMVLDNELSSTDDVVITVPSLPPKAHAGFDSTMEAGQSLLIIGHNSRDANGQQLQYQWQVLSGPAESDASFVDPSLVNPTFTTTVEGSYVLEITVTDPDGLTDSDQVNVLVTPALVVEEPVVEEPVVEEPVVEEPVVEEPVVEEPVVEEPVVEEPVVEEPVVEEPVVEEPVVEEPVVEEPVVEEPVVEEPVVEEPVVEEPVVEEPVVEEPVVEQPENQTKKEQLAAKRAAQQETVSARKAAQAAKQQAQQDAVEVKKASGKSRKRR